MSVWCDLYDRVQDISVSSLWYELYDVVPRYLRIVYHFYYSSYHHISLILSRDVRVRDVTIVPQSALSPSPPPPCPLPPHTRWCRTSASA